MKTKYLVIALIAFAAYTLGAKAGEDRYRQISGTFTKYWNDPAVKKARAKGRKARKKAAKKLEREVTQRSREFRRSH